MMSALKNRRLSRSLSDLTKATTASTSLRRVQFLPRIESNPEITNDEEDLSQIVMAKKAALNSSRRMLNYCHESQQIGIGMANDLIQQDEKLDRIRSNLYYLNEELCSVQSDLNYLKDESCVRWCCWEMRKTLLEPSFRHCCKPARSKSLSHIEKSYSSSKLAKQSRVLRGKLVKWLKIDDLVMNRMNKQSDEDDDRRLNDSLNLLHKELAKMEEMSQSLGMALDQQRVKLTHMDSFASQAIRQAKSADRNGKQIHNKNNVCFIT